MANSGQSLLPAKVVIADPEQAFLSLTGESLVAAGARIVGRAATLEGVFEWMKGEQADVVFVSREIFKRRDWIPQLSEVCAAGTASVVLVTLFAEQAYEEPALAAGAAAVISRRTWTELAPKLIRSLLAREGGSNP